MLRNPLTPRALRSGRDADNRRKSSRNRRGSRPGWRLCPEDGSTGRPPAIGGDGGQ